MKCIKATEEQLQQIYDLVQDTIKTVYPKYYPKDVVEFFCKLHSKESIKKDIEKGCVIIIMENQKVIGTGSFENNHMTRVYVLPNFQGRGYGSVMIKYIEDFLALKYDKVRLESSLPASQLYEGKKYKTIKHEKCEIENGTMLVYEIMEKTLRKVKETENVQYNSKELITNLNKLHTTDLGAERIKRNLKLNVDNVVAWCIDRINESNDIKKEGKNWYIYVDDYKITVNANSYTIITAHIFKNKKTNYTLRQL